MFGRRRVPAPPAPPAPPSFPYPIDEIDRALENAIRLLTRAFDEGGVEVGGLAIRGEVPGDVAAALASSLCFTMEGRPTFLVLGLTRDFEAMMYPPHCQLFFILNALGICEDVPALRGGFAASQFGGPLINAHFLRRWIHFVHPTAAAMKNGRLEAFYTELLGSMREVAAQVPATIAAKVDVHQMLEEWCWGFPAVYTQPLEETTTRMNQLPVTPFISKLLTDRLVELQMKGLQQRVA